MPVVLTQEDTRVLRDVARALITAACQQQPQWQDIKFKRPATDTIVALRRFDRMVNDSHGRPLDGHTRAQNAAVIITCVRGYVEALTGQALTVCEVSPQLISPEREFYIPVIVCRSSQQGPITRLGDEMVAFQLWPGRPEGVVPIKEPHSVGNLKPVAYELELVEFERRFYDALVKAMQRIEPGSPVKGEVEELLREEAFDENKGRAAFTAMRVSGVIGVGFLNFVHQFTAP